MIRSNKYIINTVDGRLAAWRERVYGERRRKRWQEGKRWTLYIEHDTNNLKMIKKNTKYKVLYINNYL